jgi:guanine deaminase
VAEQVPFVRPYFHDAQPDARPVSTGLKNLRGKVLFGSFFHTPRLGEVECLHEALVELDAAGRITAVVKSVDPAYEAKKKAFEAEGRLVALHGFILPGFVDLHVHAPQFPQLGKALDAPLEVWLQQYTFPLEARYSDLAFAEKSYRRLVRDLLANGATTAVIFATIHTEATKLLVDICLEYGLRALIGKVVMDNPAECPDFYRDVSTEEALAATEELLRYIVCHPGNRGGVYPVVTPRFAPSCTDAALKGLGEIARAHQCHIQTHCSESDWQHEYALARFGASDAETLDSFGLLTRKTVLAHGVFLSDSDMSLVARRGAGVAHCALSNIYFSNAVFPLRHALAKGVKLGLGTDISGGPSPSILDNIRMTIHASRLLEEGVDAALPKAERRRPGTRVDHKIAFHLATRGGADVLDLPLGSFEPGRFFDALQIDPEAEAGAIRLCHDESPDEVLQIILYMATRPNIAAVWTSGLQASPPLS